MKMTIQKLVVVVAVSCSALFGIFYEYQNPGPDFRIIVRDEGDCQRYVVQRRDPLMPHHYFTKWEESYFSLADATNAVEKIKAADARVDRINSLKWQVVK